MGLSAATRAKISAAMKGNKNGLGWARGRTESQRTLGSLRAMLQDRGGRLQRYLADHPEVDARRKANVVASRKPTAAARRAEIERAMVDRVVAQKALASLSPSLTQAWSVSRTKRKAL